MNERDKIMGDMISNMGKYLSLIRTIRKRKEKKKIKEIERKIKIILSYDIFRNYSFSTTYADLFIEKLDEMIASVKMIKRKKFVCPLPFVHSDTKESKKEERAIDFLNKLGICDKKGNWISIRIMEEKRRNEK